MSHFLRQIQGNVRKVEELLNFCNQRSTFTAVKAREGRMPHLMLPLEFPHKFSLFSSSPHESVLSFHSFEFTLLTLPPSVDLFNLFSSLGIPRRSGFVLNRYFFVVVNSALTKLTPWLFRTV